MSQAPFACAHDLCACESVSFNIVVGPGGTPVIGNCSACGHPYNEHKPPAAPNATDGQGTNGTAPALTTPPKTQNRPSSHGHNVCSTPIKICSLSGMSVQATGKIAKRSTGQGRMESLALPVASRSASEVRESLLHQLDGKVFFDVAGVEQQFFGDEADGCDADAMDVDGEEPAIAAPAASDDVYVPWLVGRLRALGGTPGGMFWGDTRHTSFPRGFSTRRRPDFCLLSPSATARRLWDSVAVVGEHQSCGSTDTQAVLQLADYASQIFAHQPLCLRVHAVLSFLDDRGLRLFLFDRGGAVASRLLRADTRTLSRLARMRAPQPLTLAAAVQMPLRFGDVYCCRPGIVCRGTFCALAHTLGGEAVAGVADGGVLVKLSWRSAGRINEGELLREAASRNVVGVAKYVFHRDIIDLSALRRGLSAAMADAFPLARPPPAPATPSATSSLATHGTLPDAQPSAAPRDIIDLAALRSGLSAPTEPMRFDNRTFACVAMSTIGIPVSSCTSASRVANGLLGGLIGHASLFFTGRVLHRDISSANVLYSAAPIPIAVAADAPPLLPATLAALHGFLIDLDYAIRYPPVEGLGSGAPHRTGTLPFMSIGVLMGEPHTTRCTRSLGRIRGGSSAGWESGRRL
ncbi:hypothetical protein DFH27DRAFT_309088 [Peziza echinospora]|nr:hypothetical protein DFH27DRAFT_309088 [Peziza echinospora]